MTALAKRQGPPERRAAGRPGRTLDWTPVEAGVVVEVSYDQLEGDRFRHATRFHRWRPDKDPLQCTMEQLERPEGPGFREVVQ